MIIVACVCLSAIGYRSFYYVICKVQKTILEVEHSRRRHRGPRMGSFSVSLRLLPNNTIGDENPPYCHISTFQLPARCRLPASSFPILPFEGQSSEIFFHKVIYETTSNQFCSLFELKNIDMPIRSLLFPRLFRYISEIQGVSI